jgi:hypothetical protein
MLRNLCSVCQERRPGKLATIYWAWTWPTGDRRAYKQFFDSDCIGVWNMPLQVAHKQSAHCSGCGEKVTDDERSIAVWATIYLPGRDRIDDVLEYHVPCFEKNAERFTMNAQRLPVRPEGSGTGAPVPEPQEWPDWASIRIVPK